MTQIANGVRWAQPPGIPTGNGSVVTVGTFDGIHLGHWAVLQEIRNRANESDRRSVLVTFDTHPLRVVRPDDAPMLLTTPAEKKDVLVESGIDYVVFLPFTPELSRYAPRRFVDEILVGRLGVKELVIGYDHGFGRGREGGPEALRTFGQEHGFTVDVMEPVQAHGGTVSSTRLRAMVGEGEVAEVRRCLGRPYSVRGVVVEGERKGRELGFPTANLRLSGDNKLLPAEGVYAARADLRSGRWAGAVHLGPRPVFDGFAPTLEVHLLDFDREIYGEEIHLHFVERLRGIEPFTTVDALVEQIGADVDRTRTLLDAESWTLGG